MSKAFNLMTADAFNKLCDSVKKRIKLTEDDLQRLAINAIGYSILQNDVQPANRLFLILGRSLRRDSMVAYLERHGQMAFMKQNGEKFEFFKREGIEFKPDTLAGLKWYEAKKENPIVSEWDLQAEFDKFMKKVTTKMQDKAITVENAKLFDFLNAASAEYSSIAHTEAADGDAAPDAE